MSDRCIFGPCRNFVHTRIDQIKFDSYFQYLGFTPGKVSLPDDTSIVQITAGDSHSAALDNKGKVYYWGTFRDGSGAIGLTHDGNIQKLPVPLGHHLNVKKIASGI